MVTGGRHPKFNRTRDILDGRRGRSFGDLPAGKGGAVRVGDRGRALGSGETTESTEAELASLIVVAKASATARRFS